MFMRLILYKISGAQAAVVAVSWTYWQNRLDGDPAVVGRQALHESPVFVAHRRRRLWP